MDEIKFLRGLQASYDALQNKSSLTFYYCTDTDNLYVGEELLSNNDELNAAIQRIAANEIDIETLSGIMTILTSGAETEGSVAYAIEELRSDILDDVSADYDTLSKIEGQIESLADVARSGSAADVAVSNAGVTASTVQAAIKELHDGITELTTDSVVTLEEASTATASMFKTYNFYQGDTSTTAAKSAAFIGKIDIPKDFLVKSGKVVTVTNNLDSDNESTSGLTNGTYLKLVLNSTDGLENASKIYINVASLIDVYSGAANASEVQIAVDNYVISATVADVDASKITYIAGNSRESVKAALQRLDGDDTVSGSVSKKIKDAIDALVDDTDISQSKVWSSAKVQGLIAEEYNEVNKAYTWGDYCIYQNKLFRCTYPTGGPFKAANWTEVDIADGLIGGIIRRGSGAFSYTIGSESGKEATASAYYSQAIGENAVASGRNSYSNGKTTKATGDYSYALGMNSEALNDFAYAYGHTAKASGVFSHAEGSSAKAQNDYSYAYGYGTTASGTFSHAEGNQTTAQGDFSQANGWNTTASGAFSHAEGAETTANHACQHVFGMYNVADTNASNSTERGNYIEIIGNGTANNARSNARTLDWDGNEVLAGKLTVGSGPSNSMDVATKQYVDGSSNNIIAAEYDATKNYAVGDYCIYEGNLYRCTLATLKEAWNSNHWTKVKVTDDMLGDRLAKGIGTDSIVAGTVAFNIARGFNSFARGQHAQATSGYTHAEGYQVTASEQHARAYGYSTEASGQHSLAEGTGTTASALYAHAEGDNTTASNKFAHASGSGTTASGLYSCAAGENTQASGNYSYARGKNNIASSYYATVEGEGNVASGLGSHAEGTGTTASGYFSKASGAGTTANHAYQHVFGKFNVLDTNASAVQAEGDYIEIVGNGTNNNARSNARTLDWSGNEILSGKLTLGAAPTGNMDAVTKGYVDNSVGGAVNGIIAPEYDSTSTYAVGEHVIYEGELYKCSTAIETAEDWTAAHWTKILVADEFVSDVTVNGTSVVTDGVAEIPVGSVGNPGLININTTYGLNVTSNGYTSIQQASNDNIKGGASAYRPITPEKQHQSVFYGLAKAAGDSTQSASSNAVGTYTSEAKTAIQTMLGVPGDVQVNGTSVVSNGVANIPIATGENHGTVIVPYGYGLVADSDKLRITAASTNTIKTGTNQFAPICPVRQHEAVFFGLAKAAGDSTQSASENAVGTYTSEAKTAIQTMLNVPDADAVVSDVTINGTSVVGSDGVAEIPLTTGGNDIGLVKTRNNTDGLLVASNGYLAVSKAISSHIKNGTENYRPIVPHHQHESAFYGLAKAAGDTTQSSSSNAVGTYTDTAKAAIKNMLGVSGESQTITVTGTTPTITAQPNTRYICGEVLSLDFTPCSSGICNVVFTSGSTVTVLSLPQTVKMPEWFEVETNTTYEISIMDGVYGAVMSWEA